MSIESTFGETIKELREQRQLPLREVAQALEIDTSMLGKIEKNNRYPSKQLIAKIAKFYKVSPRDLIIALISDKVASQILDGKGLENDVLKVAEKKVKYLKTINKHR